MDRDDVEILLRCIGGVSLVVAAITLVKGKRAGNSEKQATREISDKCQVANEIYSSSLEDLIDLADQKVRAFKNAEYTDITDDMICERFIQLECQYTGDIRHYEKNQLPAMDKLLGITIDGIKSLTREIVNMADVKLPKKSSKKKRAKKGSMKKSKKVAKICKRATKHICELQLILDISEELLGQSFGAMTFMDGEIHSLTITLDQEIVTAMDLVREILLKEVLKDDDAGLKQRAELLVEQAEAYHKSAVALFNEKHGVESTQARMYDYINHSTYWKSEITKYLSKEVNQDKEWGGPIYDSSKITP